MDLYNKEYKDTLTVADMDYFDLVRSVKAKCGIKIYKYIKEDGFFRNLPPLPGAVEALQKIQDDGHDITLVSAPSFAPASYRDKVEWVNEYLPFLDYNDILLGHKKYLIKGDIFIDDSPINITKYKKNWPKARIMTIGYPYNKVVKKLTSVYAGSYQDTTQAWETIYQAIQELAKR